MSARLGCSQLCRDVKQYAELRDRLNRGKFGGLVIGSIFDLAACQAVY